jgi:DNA-binding response OmpR family regulator
MHREDRSVINVLVGGLPRTLAASLEARLEGAAVHVVDSGAEALEWLAARSCQLLVLDHALPGIPAIDVVQALTEGAQASALSVLYCLRHGPGTGPERERAERLGIRTFVTHPIDVDQLAEKVRSLTHGANGGPSGDPAEAPAGSLPDASSPGPGWDRLRVSLGRRVDVLDRAAIAVLEGTITDRLKGQAWREAHQIAEILAAYGRSDAARLARDLETLLERRGDPGPAETLRFSELAVALRAEIERPVPFHGVGGLGDNRPLLLVMDRHSEFAESVGLEAEASGLRYEIATDPDAARALIGRDAPAVVLMDLDAADQPDAWIGFIAEISDRDGDTPVLVATSAASLANRVAVARPAASAWSASQFRPQPPSAAPSAPSAAPNSPAVTSLAWMMTTTRSPPCGSSSNPRTSSSRLSTIRAGSGRRWRRFVPKSCSWTCTCRTTAASSCAASCAATSAGPAPRCWCWETGWIRPPTTWRTWPVPTTSSPSRSSPPICSPALPIASSGCESRKSVPASNRSRGCRRASRASCPSRA